MPQEIDILLALLREGLQAPSANAAAPSSANIDNQCHYSALSAQQSKTPSAESFASIYNIASEQGVQAILWDAISRKLSPAANTDCDQRSSMVANSDYCANPAQGTNPATLFLQLPRTLKLRWALNVEAAEKRYDAQFKIASELAHEYAQRGIRTLVLKGIALSTLYPQPRHRPCGDLDCFLISAQDADTQGEKGAQIQSKYAEGNSIARELGAIVDDSASNYKHSHIQYKGLTVENHQFCTAIRASRRAKQFERFLQEQLTAGEYVKIGTTQLECPPPLFTALFLTKHAQTHLLIEGIALRHLCDWAMFLRSEGEKLDWQKFRAICSNYGMLEFADAMTQLAEKVLAIAAPYTYRKDDTRADFLLREIIYGQQHIYTREENKWYKRVRIFANSFINARRYSYFSDTHYFIAAAQKLLGFLFDRKPRL